MGTISASLRELAHPISLLRTWHRSRTAARNEVARDLHLFAPPNSDPENQPDPYHLFDAQSGQHLLVSPLLRDLLKLAAVAEERIASHISQIAAATPLSRLFDGIENYANLIRYLRQVATPPPSVQEPKLYKGELLMDGTLTCNLNCKYCNSRRRRVEAAEGRAPSIMPLETAQRSIRFIAERMAGKVPVVYINFTLGGEPLLSLERYRNLKNYCTQLSKDLGLSIILNMNTNGTALNEECIRYCEENEVTMAVSIDGPKEFHDAMRPFSSGRGSYDAIVKNLPRMLNSSWAGLRDAAAGAVLTALYPFPKQVYQHLIELGFRHIVVTPVRDFEKYEWSLRAETLNAFKSGYTEYAEWMLECLVNGDDRIYATLVEFDFFARFLMRVIRGNKQAIRCEAGRNTFGVGIDGRLYPCDNFIGWDAYCLGDVHQGIDETKRSEFLQDTMIDQKPVCKDCWARYLCGGGCYFSAVLANGDHRIPNAVKCELVRHLVELSIWIIIELRQRNPQALKRLCYSVSKASSPAVIPMEPEEFQTVAAQPSMS